jgi:hypothetical protein
LHGQRERFGRVAVVQVLDARHPVGREHPIDAAADGVADPVLADRLRYRLLVLVFRVDQGRTRVGVGDAAGDERQPRAHRPAEAQARMGIVAQLGLDAVEVGLIREQCAQRTERVLSGEEADVGFHAPHKVAVL